MNNGFIFIWRKLRENPIYSNSKAVHIWIECLMRATYKQRAFYQGREKVELEPGQFIMGYREFGNKIKIGASTVKYWMDKFEKVERMIERKTNAKGTLVTVLNWDEYQEVERKVAQEQNDDETLVESNKKVKKVNKEEKTTTTSNEVNQELQDYHKNPPDKDHQDWTAQDCVKNFYYIYYDSTGTIAKPNWGKEGKQAKRLLEDYTAKEVDGATRYLFYRKAKEAKLSKGKQFGWVKGTMKEYQEWAAEQRQLSEEKREWEDDREKAEQIIEEIADEF